MKLNYFPDTDSLYIDLSEQTSVGSRAISDGIVLDYDAQGNLESPLGIRKPLAFRRRASRVR